LGSASVEEGLEIFHVGCFHEGFGVCAVCSWVFSLV
jgi:hypothetical protein